MRGRSEMTQDAMLQVKTRAAVAASSGLEPHVREGYQSHLRRHKGAALPRWHEAPKLYRGNEGNMLDFFEMREISSL